MKLTRRKALAGIGIGAVAGGAVFGSGAFSQTELSRDFALSIQPDDASQLRLRPGDGGEDSDAIVEEDGNVYFDFEDISGQADTIYEQAIEIENQHQSGEDLWVYVPRGVGFVDADDLVRATDTGQESVEFLVDKAAGGVADDQLDHSEQDGAGDNPDVNVNAGKDLIDISLDPGYPEGDTAFSSANNDNPDRAGGSATGKIRQTGAVQVEYGESVEVEIRFLIDGLREAEQASGAIKRFRAQRVEPGEGEVDLKDEWDDTGTLEDLEPEDILDDPTFLS